MKKKIIFILMYIVLILLSTKVYGTTGKTLNEVTRIRKEASTDSEIVALVSSGADVEIISEEGEWYKVKYSTYVGYMRKDMLEVENQSKTKNVVAQNISTETATAESNIIENNTTENTSNEISSSIQKGAIRKNIN